MTMEATRVVPKSSSCGSAGLVVGVLDSDRSVILICLHYGVPYFLWLIWVITDVRWYVTRSANLAGNE